MNNSLDEMQTSPLPSGEGQGEGLHRPQTNRARRLRKDPTEAEKVLWQKIRNQQLGFKFKRQSPLYFYVADFLCAELKLIVEVDGGQHNQSAADEARTAYLNAKGYELIRFWNNEVLENTDGVAQSLTLTLSRRERELKEKLNA